MNEQLQQSSNETREMLREELRHFVGELRSSFQQNQESD